MTSPRSSCEPSSGWHGPDNLNPPMWRTLPNTTRGSAVVEKAPCIWEEGQEGKVEEEQRAGNLLLR